jgi:rubrerythrin
VRKLAVQQVPQDADIPNEDHAIYNCECGFVFEADVSTSVGCPHCGRYQAW